jgi:hypothetical protein
MKELYRWQHIKKKTKPPLPKKLSLWQIFLKINPIHAFTITDNFPKFHVYPSTNVGAIQTTTYYDTNLTTCTSPSQKSDPFDNFFWKSIPSMLLLLMTISQSFVYISINKCRYYPGDNVLWHTYGLIDGQTDGSKRLRHVGYSLWCQHGLA